MTRNEIIIIKIKNLGGKNLKRNLFQYLSFINKIYCIANLTLYVLLEDPGHN